MEQRADEREKINAPNDTTRRRLLQAGAVLVPTILTLHATPAWAQTDYTMTAYRYGVNKGKCRNSNYNPNANPNSEAGKEFIECRGGGQRRRDLPGDDMQGNGSTPDSDFQIR